MNKQRKVLITITYNEMGIIIDTKTEELGSSAQLGTNLAEVGTDTISRQAAIDYFVTNVGFHDEDGDPIEDECELREIWTGYFDGIPPAEPELIECDPVKACIEVTMNKVFSAYRYLSMLEDLKVYGYVLAKRSEVTE